MSRSQQPPVPDDPDDTPTRIGGSGPRDEDPTVPSLKKGHAGPVPQAPKGPSDPLIGKELGGCRITALLGRGAMGAVYKARQLKLDRDVAVKVIRPEMMSDPRTLKRFEVEARTVGRFNSAHVVMVHDVGFEQGVHYLVMEFVQGKNLRDHVKLLAGGRLPAAEAIPLLRQACKGLEEAQRLGVIHRDIKPDNLMLTDRGILKIADFGIAKPIQEDFSMTLTSELIGTPLYMSPEQCQGAADLDFRSDMYSLGATFYYLLTGEPPVRASSVYELIQTKTKLENLCLWKALPDLDQNHPLSRVIERMTALDRADRYDSYEALLNDIVIVEQGGTVQRLAPKPEKKELPKLPVPAPKGRRVAALVAGLAVAAAAAGGIWWVATNGGGGSTPPPRVDPADPKPDPAVVRGRLLALHERLAQFGPSDALRAEATEIVAEGPELREQEALLAAIATGLEVKARLQSIQAPDRLEPPFPAIAEHFAAVDRAVVVSGTPLPSLLSWLASAKTAARAEETLGARAAARLLAAWTLWNADRGKVGGDTQKLAELDERLDSIEAGRQALSDLIPGVRADLEKSLPADAIAAARAKLMDTSIVPVDVDVGDAIAEIRAEFDTKGPDDSLSKRVGELRPTKTDQAAACKALLDELGRARERKTNAENLRTGFPRDPQLPFDDVESYFQRIELAIEPLQGADKRLPPWAESLRTMLRDEQVLQASVVAACGSAFRSWQQESAVPGADKDRLAARLATLTAGKARAAKLFPAVQVDLDREVPAAEIDAALARVEQAAGKQRWLGLARELAVRVEAVRSVADWRAAEPQLAADLAASESDAATFGGDAEVQREQKRIADARGRWVQADAKVKEIAGKIAAADLTGAESVARAGVLGAEGRDELRLLGDTAARCREAFAALDQSLDIAGAVKLLGDAKAVLAPVAGLAVDVDRRIAAWSAKLGELQQAAVGLVSIPGGRVRGENAKVESFLISPTEVSHGDFSTFLTELRAAVSGIDDPARRFEAVASRFDGSGVDAAAVEALLAIEPRRGVGAKMPADRLTWHAAAAYAAWRGQALPTLGEWSLAAFGDLNKHKYPWGGANWSAEPKDRNSDRSRLVEVDDGGLCWRVQEGVRIHHLAGNVAEWLAADAGATAAALVGGKYNDGEPTAKERATGVLQPAAKSDASPGFGARIVLRPRTFPGLDWPR